MRHVTLYVAVDGGGFQVWRRQVEDASGQAVFEGEPGHSYEFLALATDLAGNREVPPFGADAEDDGSSVNLGQLPTVPETTPPNFGIEPEPSPDPSTNPLFIEAESQIPAAPPEVRPSEFETVLRPFTAHAFATGIPTSGAGIGPLALAQAPDGSILVSGGVARNQLYRFGLEGGVSDVPLVTLDDPIYGMAFDSQGRLWATTGGGPLLQLDPETGSILARYGDGLTMALAVEPGTDRIFVSSRGGIEIFDPTNETFTRYSRDRNLRVGSLAFDSSGTLWAVTWPDRRQVVRFNDRARAEVVLTFDSDLDSIAFGQPNTPLRDLLFVSHNSGAGTSPGTPDPTNSVLTMVDLATLRRVDIANGGTRGDSLITTRDGRILLSQSNQVDVINPLVAPSVVATTPPEGGLVALPLSLLGVTFDQDMYVGEASDADSVLNPANYTLTAADGTPLPILQVIYDSETRTALLVARGVDHRRVHAGRPRHDPQRRRSRSGLGVHHPLHRHQRLLALRRHRVLPARG